MKTIGRYQIIGLLGKGGMSRVYQVKVPIIDKVSALKRLEPHPSLTYILSDDQIKQLFINEAKRLAGLRHPNIVEIWDFDEIDEKPFFVMDYHSHNLGVMIGETYRPEFPSRIVRIDRTIYYIRQVLKGLACMHDFGIIHRDIKPFNMLITENDTLKISDLGLSKARGEIFAGPSRLKIGSPWYAAPEQEDHPDQVDFSADLYSVGVTLYRMLTGSLPLEDDVSPSRINPDLDYRWDRFIGRAIDKNKHERFRSAREMLAELNALERAWADQIDQACMLSQAGPLAKIDHDAERVSLRKTPIKVGPDKARELFGADAQWKPIRFIENYFEVDKQAQIVKDYKTGLVWQISGAPYSQTFETAQHYIQDLNQTGFGNIKTWRIPTIDELISLITKTPHTADFCAEPVFDTRLKWLWSVDRRSFSAAWYVSLDLGFISYQDMTGLNDVKAVSDLKI